ncbi:MAG: hypothetical protein Q7R76_00615 [Candidatus Woesearchaeota archaeon]|nr:hypothetical protein [Candidatus Woesearchaeota archaeon]
MKRRLTSEQEFKIMKLVLDKFLWLGFLIMAAGMYELYTKGFAALQDALLLFVSGAVILVIFMIIIVKEFEIVRHA